MVVGGPEEGTRVLLGQRTPDGMVEFQWTGAEPSGLDSTMLAEECGAVWEGDELVTYNFDTFRFHVEHAHYEFLEDSD